MQTIGHEHIRSQFSQLIKDKKLPQSMLFYGTKGIGKKKIALEIISNLFCINQTACGKCQACQMICESNHPDLFLITPTPPKSQQSKASKAGSLEVRSNWTIKTEQIQALRQKLVHYPLMASHQIIIIDDAEKMTVSTANSLLKILEEPRPQQIFVLITSELHRILPTVRSRTSKFYFSPLNQNEVSKIIKDNCEASELPNDDTLHFLIRSFQGSVANTLKAIYAGFDWSLLNELANKKHDFVEISNKAKEIVRSDIDLNIFLQCLRQRCLENTTKAASTANADIAFMNKIKDAQKQLSRHIQKEFILENLFL